MHDGEYSCSSVIIPLGSANITKKTPDLRITFNICSWFDGMKKSINIPVDKQIGFVFTSRPAAYGQPFRKYILVF